MSKVKENKELQSALSQIEKQYGAGSIMLMSDRPQSMPVIPTGSLLLDEALGVGGYPEGRIIEIFGPESSGKCLVKETRVLTPDGLKTIEELFKENNVSLKGEPRSETVSITLVNGLGDNEKTTHFTINGVKEVFELKTNRGATIKATANHPFATKLLATKERSIDIEWTELENLKVGDTIYGMEKVHYGNELGLYAHEIVSIESVGEEETYDFSMEHSASFIAEGLITHNTTLALHAVAEAQKQGKAAAFIDAEHAVDPTYARNLGVNVDELILSQPDYGEQALEIVDILIRSGQVGLIIVDSVAALTPQAELEGEMTDANVGLQARMMSKAMRKIAGGLNNTDTTIIFINQLREKIGQLYGPNETTTGGRALRFYSSIRLDVRRREALKEGKDFVGNKTEIKVVKNKVAPPFKTASTEIVYGRGINRMAELITAAVNYDIIDKAGSWYSYGDTRLGQGAANVENFLRENPDVYQEVEEKVNKAMMGIVDDEDIEKEEE